MQEEVKLIRVGERFEVILPANPTTGYLWHESFDISLLALVEKKFHLSSDRVGAGGEQIFVFGAIEPGETLIKLRYKRPWESIPLTEKNIAVKIT